MTGVSFSRLQLAAALLEYDNDPESPESHRSAKHSAIFSHLRQAKPHIQKAVDHLGVDILNDTGSINSGYGAGRRKSLASIDAFRNLFNSEEPDGVDGEDHSDEEFEVDLSSWGLDSFVQKEKSSMGKGKGNLKLERSIRYRQNPRGRTMSLGEIDTLARTSEALNGTNIRLSENLRPRSAFSLTDAFSTGHSGNDFSFPNEPCKDTIPFPSSPPTKGYTHPNNDLSNESSYPNTIPSSCTLQPSDVTVGTGISTNNFRIDTPNPFVLRPPSPSRSSRFDPKVISHNRTLSNATGFSANTGNMLNEEKEMLRPSSTRSLSRRGLEFITSTSMNAQNMHHNVGQSFSASDVERRFSRTELMHPKVLIMPSPLQNMAPDPPANPRDGFLVSTDGPPLPPEARTIWPISASRSALSNSYLAASNSFTPNPRLSLSTSQLLFRNSLVVGGQRDVSFNDIDGSISRAAVDGERVPFEQESTDLRDELKDLALSGTEEVGKQHRLPGKLYGRSLMDELEVRKAAIHSKRRVFTGDDRPSMMNRSSLLRSSTLFDPEILLGKPALLHTSTFSSALAESAQRSGSLGDKPLLNFDTRGDDNNEEFLENLPKTRSVFGVDTLWERELRRLEQLKNADFEENLRLKEIGDLKSKKGIRKERRKERRKDEVKGGEIMKSAFHLESKSISRSVSLPPVLPDIFENGVKDKTATATEISDEGSSSNSMPAIPIKLSIHADMRGWVSDEEKSVEPLRVTGIGPRYPHLNHLPEDSDEDTPLAATIYRLSATAHRHHEVADDLDEEDKPLSSLAELYISKKVTTGESQLPSPSNIFQDDDDNEPLGLRASKLMLTTDEDDELPLALHPEHQRKTQIHSQQQQMVFQNTIGFGLHSAINPIFTGFGPSLQPELSPLMFTSAYNVKTAVQDSGKFGRVDRWRRDVAGEGGMIAGTP